MRSIKLMKKDSIRITFIICVLCMLLACMENIHSVDLDLSNVNIETLLVQALENQDYQKIPRIVSRIDLENVSKEFSIKIYTLALRCETEECIHILLEAGLNPDTFDIESQRNMIFNALDERKIQHLKILLSYGANVNVKDSNDQTPLLSAIVLSQYKSAIFLLENGADKKITDRFKANAYEVFIETQPTDHEYRDKDFYELKRLLETNN